MHNYLVESTAPTSAHRNNDLGYVMRAVDGLGTRITELKGVAEKFASEARGSDSSGHLRIRKLKWLWEKEQIQQQREALRRARSPLLEALQLLQLKQT